MENRGWIPVVIVSARDEPKDIFQGYKREADYCLTKPLDLQNLSRAIHLMLSLAPVRQKTYP